MGLTSRGGSSTDDHCLFRQPSISFTLLKAPGPVQWERWARRKWCTGCCPKGSQIALPLHSGIMNPPKNGCTVDEHELEFHQRLPRLPVHFNQPFLLVLRLLILEPLSCRRELPQLMAYHILCDCNIMVHLTIMHLELQPHEVWQDGRRTCCCSDG